jgi:hypothetical protein
VVKVIISRYEQQQPYLEEQAGHTLRLHVLRKRQIRVKIDHLDDLADSAEQREDGGAKRQGTPSGTNCRYLATRDRSTSRVRAAMSASVPASCC